MSADYTGLSKKTPLEKQPPPKKRLYIDPHSDAGRTLKAHIEHERRAAMILLQQPANTHEVDLALKGRLAELKSLEGLMKNKNL